MVIDTLRRLTAIERALRDIIMPAIKPEMANAIEQAGYVLSHVAMMKDQIMVEPQYRREELVEVAGLANDLREIAYDYIDAGSLARIDDVLNRSDAMITREIPALAAINGLVADCREACDLLLTVVEADEVTRVAAYRQIVAQATRQEEREAAWLSGAAGQWIMATSPAVERD